MYGAREVLTAWERERYDCARERQRQRERECSDQTSGQELSYWAVQQDDVSGNEGDVEDSDDEVYRMVHMIFRGFNGQK